MSGCSSLMLRKASAPLETTSAEAFVAEAR